MSVALRWIGLFSFTLILAGCHSMSADGLAGSSYGMPAGGDPITGFVSHASQPEQVSWKPLNARLDVDIFCPSRKLDRLIQHFLRVIRCNFN